jgi:aminopeptidase N
MENKTDELVKYRKDYRPAPYLINSVNLTVELGEEMTLVTSSMHVHHNSKAEKAKDLVLDGREQDIVAIKINDKVLDKNAYKQADEDLTIFNAPDDFMLEIKTHIKPQENTTLMGLYKSSGNYCTQCESDGFRRITYCLDRPDVMSKYETTIIGDKTSCPVLLSNGNLVDHGELDDGRHFAKWDDPFKKPCYLFALVAGDLAHIEDHFTTMSDRKVTLRIYSEQKNIDKCYFAMDALKKSMKWDEEKYGREYDLDIFMIVAVDDFNFGAMENKGLNVFNAQYVLAKPETATDQDYAGIDTVVSHEYFHNWTGDRVTLRDWFQLTLKEGLTVFRDHSFSKDIGLRDVVRIDQVQRLRNLQFPEDAGPLAHPIRPDSYINMNNFYTATVYEKGSEVIGMQKTIVGDEGYRKATDLYFERHDGHAVTCEDFIKAMEDANDADLSQFRLWYSQAGTPVVSIESSYDAAASVYHLDVKQTCPDTPGQSNKLPFHIPIRMSLLDKTGGRLPLQLDTEDNSLNDSVLHVCEAEQRFSFVNIGEEPTPSFLHHFSAPIKLEYAYTDAQLAFLIANDDDSFSAWEACQLLALREIKSLMAQHQTGESLSHNPLLFSAFDAVLANDKLDKAFIAKLITLPSFTYIGGNVEQIDVDAIYAAHRYLSKTYAKHAEQTLLAHYQALNKQKPYYYDLADVGERALKNACLNYLAMLGEKKHDDLAMAQFNQANNMTDQLTALRVLTRFDNTHRQEALKAFYDKWQAETLVVDKWLTIQGMSETDNVIDEVKALTKHDVFNIKNPNKVRALIGGFAANFIGFHHPDGKGYAFLTDLALELDAINPMVTSRLIAPLTKWRRYDEKRQALMKAQLERLLAKEGLSKNVYEIVSKSLA